MLAKEGYRSALRGNVSVGINLNSVGFISHGSETVATQKNFRFTAAEAANTLADNQRLTDIFLGFTDSSAVQKNMSVTWGV